MWPPFYDYRARAHFRQFARCSFHRSQILYFQAGQSFRFRHVGREHGGSLKQFRRQIFDATGIKQFRPRGRFHHRIMHYNRELVRVQKFRDHYGIAAIALACRSSQLRYRNLLPECPAVRAIPR